jgi:hypothetical protein
MENKEMILVRHGLQKEDMVCFTYGEVSNAGKLLIGKEQLLHDCGDQITDEDFMSFLQESAKTIYSPGEGC